LNYDECLSNDFVFSKGGKSLTLANSDIHDWQITFADTGLRSNIGQRLLAAQKYVAGEELFLANYTDGLTDLDLPSYLAFARAQDKITTFLSVLWQLVLMGSLRPSRSSRSPAVASTRDFSY
jgi:glucose-1-phosphate cytidylyltransferase